MLRKLTVKLTLFLLQRADLSLADRNLLTTALLDRLGALPLRDIVKVTDDGSIVINDRALDFEKLGLLRDSARTILNNQAWRTIRDQVAFQAISIGIHKMETVEQSYFARAALWWKQQELLLLSILAQDNGQIDRDLTP
jgi:hypothetical protein